MSQPTRQRPRHAWEDGAFSVALGWVAKKDAEKDAEQTHRSALEKRARPIRRRGPAIVSGLVVGSVALLSVWGLSRPRLEAARPVEVSLADEVRLPTRMAVQSASPNTEPVSTPLGVQNGAQLRGPEPLSTTEKVRRQVPNRNVASTWTPAPLAPESAPFESLQSGSDAPSKDAKDAAPSVEQESAASASTRVPARDGQNIDGSDIVDWFIKEFPRRR